MLDFDNQRMRYDTLALTPATRQSTSRTTGGRRCFRTPPETINDIEPLPWDDAGEQVIGVFTHSDRAEPFAHVALHLAPMPGRTLLDILPGASGLLVNPRSETFTFLISSAQVIRRDVA
ncbi:SseB family protein [Mesorhizobium japonicum]|uniref:SseB family protein n=1 Tax=Mesorhizobium japonicum TaxID=2066070 RepID=UPI003B5B55F4